MTLEIITSDALGPIRHGFFTRRGGASSGIFDGLNCGTGSSDQTEIVAINRQRVQQAMGDHPLISVHQVHSSECIIAESALTAPVKADAIATNVSGLTLTVLTADCQPILFHDAKNGVIAAAHAGWRGALDGILTDTIEKMETLGAERHQIVAVIGPCISQSAYEVGREFRDHFLATDPTFDQFFSAGQSRDKYQFNLPMFGKDRLDALGLRRAVWTGHCTYSDAQRFYSYRRSTHLGQADYGRLISCITL